MKRMLVLITVLGLVAYGTSVANAVVVIGGATNNGNMDKISVSSQVLATPTGWIATSDPVGSPPVFDGLSSEPWNNIGDATGDCNGGTVGCGVFIKSFQGTAATPFNASLHQDNPGTPGMAYMLHGWVGAGPGYSGLSDPATRTELALEFLDVGGVAIPASGSVSDLDAGLLAAQGNGNPFSYDEYWVMATAPVGTATVRARFSMVNGYPVPNAGDAALVTDYYTLTCVPEPASLALGLIGVLGFLGIGRRR